VVWVRALTRKAHGVVFLGRTLYSHSTTLHPGVRIGTSDLNAGGSPVMDLQPIQGRVQILLVPPCYRGWDKLRPDEPPGLYKHVEKGFFL